MTMKKDVIRAVASLAEKLHYYKRLDILMHALLDFAHYDKINLSNEEYEKIKDATTVVAGFVANIRNSCRDKAQTLQDKGIDIHSTRAPLDPSGFIPSETLKFDDLCSKTTAYARRMEIIVFTRHKEEEARELSKSIRNYHDKELENMSGDMSKSIRDTLYWIDLHAHNLRLHRERVATMLDKATMKME